LACCNIIVTAMSNLVTVFICLFLILYDLLPVHFICLPLWKQPFHFSRRIFAEFLPYFSEGSISLAIFSDDLPDNLSRKGKRIQAEGVVLQPEFFRRPIGWAFSQSARWGRGGS
ncbi:MAG: hypothetical protein IJI21_06345, partial [Clostridia bacterium]|nr:hypothetical protein [Clostridia bacterium]